MDDQPLPWLRVCLQILLCAVHARIHGAGRGRCREKDFCEKGCGGAAGAGSGGGVVWIAEVPGGLTGRNSHWEGNRPISAGGTGGPGGAGGPGGKGETRGAWRFFDL